MLNQLLEHKHIPLILEVLKEKKRIRRSDLYREVMQKQKKRFGEITTYQVISREVDNLLKAKEIKIVDGGKRSQILSVH